MLYEVITVVDHVIRPECATEGGLLGATGRRDHPCAQRLADLDRRLARPSSAADHEKGLPGKESSPRLERDVRGVEGNQEAGSYNFV